MLRKWAEKRSVLVWDADWYEASVELGKVSGLRPRGGLMLQAYADNEKKASIGVRIGEWTYNIQVEANTYAGQMTDVDELKS